MPTTPSLPTQNLLAIEHVEHDTLVVAGGGLRKLILVSGLNFELRSDEEQAIVLQGFQSFLNSLDFPLQFFIHSRKINIDGYVHELELLEQAEENTLLASLVHEYRAFVASLVAQNPIMEKRFFVVVPYDPNPFTATSGKVLATVLKLFKKKDIAEASPAPAPESIHATLDQRVDQVINSLTSLGLRAAALTKEEITELFYNLYNPETIERHVR